jgi:hypothetical protein
VNRRPARPAEITAAVRVLFPAIKPLRTAGGPGIGEYTITMPAQAAYHWGVHDPRGAWEASRRLSAATGADLHVSEVTAGRKTAAGQNVTVLVLDAGLLREAAQRDLTGAGYTKTEARRVIGDAIRFPGTWAYTGDRHRAVVYQMPAGRLSVHDTAESEERIKTAGRLGSGQWTQAASR